MATRPLPLSPEPCESEEAMSEETNEKSIAERWFEEQQAWQQTMREYADSMAKDEQFLTHLGNAMHGSLLAGTPYPQPTFGDASGAANATATNDLLQEVLFSLKRIEGRLRDLGAAIEDLDRPKPSHTDTAE